MDATPYVVIGIPGAVVIAAIGALMYRQKKRAVRPPD
jgi:hypothetical protein